MLFKALQLQGFFCKRDLKHFYFQFFQNNFIIIKEIKCRQNHNCRNHLQE